MIEIKGISVSYDDHAVLQSVSITLHPGKIHGIVGLNGAGKTSFFNLLAKLIKPDAGNVLLNNKPISIRDSAYLETVNYFYSGITGNEYLKIFSQTNREFNLQVLQQYFKLPLDELIAHYSTGMKKKLALLAILKQDKPLYIFDEPFNGLDLETNKLLEVILETLRKKNKMILLSSHVIEPLITVCDTIHLLQNGQFERHFEKDEFAGIDEVLFGKLKVEAAKNISSAI